VLRLFDFEGFGQVPKVLLHVLMFLLDTCDVGHVISVVFFPLAVFGVKVACFLLIVIGFFLVHDSCCVVFDSTAALEVFVLEMLDLLHMRGDVCPVTIFAVLHVSIEVTDLGVELFDLLPGVVIEVMDHVFLDLEHVTFDLGILKLFLEVGDGYLKLITLHCHVVIFWLCLFLPFLSFLSLLLFRCHTVSIFISLKSTETRGVM